MKQVIVCTDCAKDIRKMFPTDEPYPGEHVKLLEGTAKGNFLCDSCGTPIKQHAACTALSIWTDEPFIEGWEVDYIEETQP